MIVYPKIGGSARLRLEDFSSGLRRVSSPLFLRRAESLAAKAGKSYLLSVRRYFPDSSKGSRHPSSLDLGQRLSKNWVSDVEVNSAGLKVRVRNLLGSSRKGETILSGLESGFSGFVYILEKRTSFLASPGIGIRRKRFFLPAGYPVLHKATKGFHYREKAAREFRAGALPELKRGLAALILSEVTKKAQS